MRRVVVLGCAAALATACGSEKRSPAQDSEARAPRDAPAVATAADREALFRAVPTELAVKKTIERLAAAPHPAGSEANSTVAAQLLANLGRLGLRAGSSQHRYALPRFDGGFVAFDWDAQPLRNAFAFIEGATDDAIIVGTAFDAADTSAAAAAGPAALIEIARGFTALARSGWRPQRTIILALWDGGALGELGLSAWVEEQREMLRARGVAYFELGSLAGSRVVIEHSAALASAVAAPGAGTGPGAGAGEHARADVTVPLGAGATALWHRAGIASARWRLDGAAPASDDAVIATATAFAQSIGLAVLRLADAEHVGLRYDTLPAELTAALAAYPLTALDRTRLDAALAALADRTRAPVASAACDRALVTADRAFLVDAGLAARPWYRNVLLGPVPPADATVPLPELAAAPAQPALDRLAAAIERLTAALAPCAP